MKKAKFFLIIFIGGLLFQISCNKELNTSPIIDVKTPLQNQSFSFGDTIFVKAEIQDKVPIVSVSVSLVNSSKTEVSSQQNQTFDQKLVHVNNEIILDNPQLESGQYFIHIVARNDINSKSYFQPIQISGLQRSFRGLFLITKSSDQSLDVLLMDSNETVLPFLSINGDYLNSDINNKYQRLVICGSKTGNLTVVNLDTKIIDWSIVNQSTQDNPYFYSLVLTQNRIFSATRNSEIRSFDFSGSIVNSYSLTNQRYAENMLALSDRFFAQTTDVLGGAKRLIQFYTGSSLSISDHTISMDIKSWFWFDGKLIVFANTGNFGRIYSYNYTNNVFTLLNNTSSVITKVSPLSVSDYLIICNDGVYLYNAGSSNSMNKVISQNGIKNVIFDNVNQRVYIQSVNKIEVFTFPDFESRFEYNSSKEIVNLHLWYNK